MTVILFNKIFLDVSTWKQGKGGTVALYTTTIEGIINTLVTI